MKTVQIPGVENTRSFYQGSPEQGSHLQPLPPSWEKPGSLWWSCSSTASATLGIGLGWAGNCKASLLYFQIKTLWGGFHLLQGFGEGNTEKECLTYRAVCTWSPRAGDGSLAMPRLVSGAAPSRFGVSQSPRGASYKAALLMSQTPGRKMHPGTPVTRAAIGVWRAVSVWGSQAAPLPSLMAQAAEDILR